MGPRAGSSPPNLARRQNIIFGRCAPSRPRGAALFLTATAKGSAGDIRQPHSVNTRWRLLLRASLFRWRVRGKSSGRLIGFLHAFIPLSVRGASQSRSEASARPWRQKMVTQHLPAFWLLSSPAGLLPPKTYRRRLKKDEAGSPYTAVPCATVSCTDSNQRAAHRLREPCGPSSRRAAPRRRR